MSNPLRSAFLALVVATSAFASTTYVVDDNGGSGVDFTDLQTAIDAAAPGDVLRVRAGNYGAFVLAKELTIVADDGATVGVPGGATSSIGNLAAGARIAISGLSILGLQVSQCDGAVLFDDVSMVRWSTPIVRIDDCDDVRFNRCSVGSSAIWSTQWGAVLVTGSRVEFSQSYVSGPDAEDDDNGDYGVAGACGVRCDLGSRVHFALTSVYGGDGGDACYGLCAGGYGGDGAPAIAVTGGSTAIVAGTSTIKGGHRGIGNFPGMRASGVAVYASSHLRWSTATIQGGGPPSGAPPPIALLGGTAQNVSPPDPTLAISGNAVAGGAMTLTFYGLPGTNGRLQQGNQMLVDVDGLAEIEKLNNRIRIHPLGPVPASGTITYALTVPSNWVPGQFRVFQGLEIDASSAMLIERTNSVPVVVH